MVASRNPEGVRLIQRPTQVGQRVVVWTLLEGTQSAEDLRGQSQQEELRGDGGAKGEASGVFTFSVFTFQRK